MTNQRHAEIVGAGLAGLSMATALGQRGWTVDVHEKAPDLRMFGAGIWMWENGLKALEILGVYEPAVAQAKQINVLEIRDQDNEVMMSRQFAEGDRLLLPPRSDLYDALIASAKAAGVNIRTSSPVRSATPEGTIELESGERRSADLVVVADGIYSLVRESLYLTKKLRYLSEGYIRLLVPRVDGDPDDTITEYWKGSRRFLFDPCNDEYNYICLSCRVDDKEARKVPIDRQVWAESFPQHRDMIERFPDEARWDRSAVVTCESWHSGRAVVIGDAAHGQPPNLGQAANMTFTNVVSLAAAVDAAKDVQLALDTWEATERPLSDHVQRWSTLYGHIIGDWPESFSRERTKAVQLAMRIPWVERQLARGSRHAPYGS